MANANKQPDLTSHLGYWLRRVSNHVSGAFAEKLAAKNITVAEWVLLRTLYAGAAQPSTLADTLSVTRGAVTKITDRLIEKDLVLRQASPTDGRSHKLALTTKGKKLVPELAALADKNDEEFFSHLSPQEKKRLKRMLQLIVEIRNLKAVPLG